jgi:hypothetical protein
VTCPKCEHVIVIPLEVPEPVAEKTPAPDPSSPVPEEALPVSVRLGLVALLLGLGSILILCLPFLGGYASIGLSSAGLLVALCGLFQARSDGSGTPMPSPAAGGARIGSGFGARTHHFPLAGLAACLLSLLLALLPKLLH